MDLIIRAIENNELELFLIGKGQYKCQGRSDMTEPNDFVYCWNTEIIPYSNTVDANFISTKIRDALLKLLKFEDDVNLGLYTILTTLLWYYFYKSQNNIHFEMDLIDLAPQLKEKLKKYKVQLKHDKRWAGEEWNSSDGLWEPLINVATAIRSKYNGINCLPE